MGLSGVSGPFRGAYTVLQFGTNSVPEQLTGATQQNIWSWTAPFDVEVVDIQLWCASTSTNTRVNVLAGGASILDNTVNSAQRAGVGLTSGVNNATGGSVTATVSKNVFGTTATSIMNSVTPSTPGYVLNRARAYGAYIMSGATLSATVSNETAPNGPSGRIVGTILCFPRTHPAALRSATE
jgi:hypothetical protein